MNKNNLKFNHKNTIVNFSNSILKHFNCETHHDSIKEVDDVLKGHRKVVVLLFDGLGKHIIRKHLKDNDYMRKHYLHTMEATYPPTTVASTNGLLSGLYPIESGWLSWTTYVKEYGKIIQPFTNIDHYSDNLILPKQYSIFNKVCGYCSIFEQIKLKNPHVNVFDYKTKPIHVDGHKNLKDAVKIIDDALNSGPDVFLYFYHVSPDHELHRLGVNSSKVNKKIRQINKFVQVITKKHPDTLFLTIADHGMVDVTYLDLSSHPDLLDCLLLPPSFEVRVSTFFIKEGFKEKFETLFNKYYGEHFVLLNKKEVEDIKLFGEGNKHPRFDDFIGDYVSVSTSKYGLYASSYYSYPIEILKGHHAGYTKEEMEIDISVFNK